MASKKKSSTGKASSKPKSKSKAKSKPEPKRRSAKASTGRKSDGGDVARMLISPKDVRYLADHVIEQGNKAGNINSSVGQEISTYAKKGLDAVAFRLAVRFKKMGIRDPIKLRSVRDNFEYYCSEECLDLDSVTATKLALDDDQEPRDGDQELPGTGEDEGAEDNVTDLNAHRESEPEAA